MNEAVGSSLVDVKKGELLYSGKAKDIFKTDDPNYMIMSFRDDVSAFNGVKLEKLAKKGRINNCFNGFIMGKLEAAGIPTHFAGFVSPTESRVKSLKMLPLESVVRNRAAGGLVKRYGVAEGQILEPAIQEFFLKDDERNDPLLGESVIITLGYATEAQLDQIKRLSHQVNQVLKVLFDEAGIVLVDFKLEFGLVDGEVVVGDEFSPDGSRLWDKETLQKLDKDRFRQDLGDVIESYELVTQRLGVPDYFS